MDILMIALCATISGADSWTQVSEYGRSRLAWFKEFLELPSDIDWLPGKDQWAGLKTIAKAIGLTGASKTTCTGVSGHGFP
jgi:hypothetical protein